MTTKVVNVKDIKPAKYNPWARTTDSAIRGLKNSISKFGRVLVPVLVDQDMNLIDGHRRVACCKALGIETIEAAFVSDCEPEAVWSAVNSTSQSVKQRDWISAYVSGMPLDVMPKTVARSIGEIERLVGLEFVRSIAGDGKRGRGGLYAVACAVANYVDDHSDDFMRKAIVYMDRRGNQYLMRRAIAASVNPKLLRSKIVRNRPLSLKVG